jgi:hypothetical protein
MRELDGEARVYLRVHQIQCKVRQSTTRYNISIEREESSALRISWSYCF